AFGAAIRDQEAKQTKAVQVFAASYPLIAEQCGGEATLCNPQFVHPIPTAVGDSPQPGVLTRPFQLGGEGQRLTRTDEFGWPGRSLRRPGDSCAGASQSLCPGHPGNPDPARPPAAQSPLVTALPTFPIRRCPQLPHSRKNGHPRMLPEPMSGSGA